MPPVFLSTAQVYMNGDVFVWFNNSEYFKFPFATATGFTTAKGSLVRSILFPKPVGFQFFRDALRFVGFLAILGRIVQLH